ncbi:MAG TPA: hypothetical protein VI387_00770 [Candidatus Brocadiales bacterium]|nr:hypothetical protein [Candidatus Brocadiales bacterium]
MPPPFPFNDYILKAHLYYEISHQYWYGVVANNEFEDAWLDEGLASYWQMDLLKNIHGILKIGKEFDIIR